VVLPDDPAALERLPGIGPYTARAVVIFACNRDLVTIDTNIRRVILHEFGLPNDLSRAELEGIARQLMPRGDARNWHYALMDYSALKLPRQLTIGDDAVTFAGSCGRSGGNRAALTQGVGGHQSGGS
jgi:A/G-specific adenine glycosylase